MYRSRFLRSLMLGLLVACGDPSGAPATPTAPCPVSDSRHCRCDDGETGREICLEGGLGWSRCYCENGAGAPPDDASIVDPTDSGQGDPACPEGHEWLDGACHPGEGVQECPEGHEWADGACHPSQDESICGDGVLDDGERCDDGNQREADGCTAECQPGPGFLGCVEYDRPVTALCAESGWECGGQIPNPPPDVQCGRRCEETLNLRWSGLGCQGDPSDHRGCDEPGQPGNSVIPYCVTGTQPEVEAIVPEGGNRRADVTAVVTGHQLEEGVRIVVAFADGLVDLPVERIDAGELHTIVPANLLPEGSHRLWVINPGARVALLGYQAQEPPARDGLQWCTPYTETLDGLCAERFLRCVDPPGGLHPAYAGARCEGAPLGQRACDDPPLPGQSVVPHCAFGPPPLGTGVEPDEGNRRADIEITVRGGDFLDPAQIVVGEVPLVTTFVDALTLTAVIPADGLDEGVYGVWVVNPDGQEQQLPAAYRAFEPRPSGPGFQPCTEYRNSVSFLCNELGLECDDDVPNPPPDVQCGQRCGERIHLRWGGLECREDPSDHRGCNEPGQPGNSVMPYCVTGAQPVLHGVEPERANRRIDVPLRITGEQLEEGVTVRVGGHALAVERVDATTLHVTIPANLLPEGPHPLRVFNPGARFATRSWIAEEPPAVPGYQFCQPYTASLDDLCAEREMVCAEPGAGQAPGVDCGEHCEDDGHLFFAGARCEAAAIGVAGCGDVPPQEASVVPFCVLRPAPVVAGIEPESGNRFSHVEVEVSGQHFTEGAVIHIGDLSLETRFEDAGRLTATIPAASLEPGGLPVTVQNPDEQLSELADVRYTAIEPAPSPPGFQTCVRYVESVDYLCRELGLRCVAPPEPPPGFDCGGRCNENAHLTWDQDQCGGQPSDHRGCGEPGIPSRWLVPYCVAQ